MGKLRIQKAWAVVYGPKYPVHDEGTPIAGESCVPVFWTRAGAREWMREARWPESKDWHVVPVTITGVRAR